MTGGDPRELPAGRLAFKYCVSLVTLLVDVSVYPVGGRYVSLEGAGALSTGPRITGASTRLNIAACPLKHA